MSYEGSLELLCANGHYFVIGCHDYEPKTCSLCGDEITHTHSIDETNGADPELPSTMPAPKEQIGKDNCWKEDHYGTRYAIAIPRYKPLDQWIKSRS